MMNLYQRELYHSWIGDKWKKHKYVDRIKLPGGGYRYIYPEDLKKKTKQVKGSVEDVMNTVKDVVTWGAGGTLVKKFVNDNREKKAREAERKRREQEEKDRKWKEYQDEQKKKDEARREKNRKEREDAAREKQKRRDEKRKDAVKKEYGEKEPKLSDEHKYLAKIKTPYGWRYFYDQDELDAYYAAYGNDAEVDLLLDYGLKEESTTIGDDIVEINEKYDRGAEYQNNCYSCTINYDLRRRGYDTEAIPDPDGENMDNILSCYEGGREALKTHTDSDTTAFVREMTRQMESEGEGARGNLLVYWVMGGGHSMAWEVHNGQAAIIDCQTQQVYTGEDINELMAWTWHGEQGGVSWLRTDDLQLTEDVLKYVNKN